MYDDGLSIAFGAVDLIFYITLYIFLNLMNRESFYENLVVRGIIGIIIVDLISHWLVIFFESEFTCIDKYEQADLSVEGFFHKISTTVEILYPWLNTNYVVSLKINEKYIKTMNGANKVFNWLKHFQK